MDNTVLLPCGNCDDSALDAVFEAKKDCPTAYHCRSCLRDWIDIRRIPSPKDGIVLIVGCQKDPDFLRAIVDARLDGAACAAAAKLLKDGHTPMRKPTIIGWEWEQ